jgi:hypothetical protein
MKNIDSHTWRRSAFALLLGAGTLLASSARAAPNGERIEISGPIFPMVNVLYASEGTNFPATLAGEQTLAHAAAVTFETLLATCSDPNITHATEGVVLSPTQLAQIYNLVAECAYVTYTVKPYWIPQLVDDVDICATELGAGWRLPTEADVASLSEANFTFIHDTLSATSGGSFWGTLYFSVNVFVRSSEGTIKKANLGPGVATRITALAATGDALKNHDESGTALRCIRRTALP